VVSGVAVEDDVAEKIDIALVELQGDDVTNVIVGNMQFGMLDSHNVFSSDFVIGESNEK
jgi:hypothetical protein